MIGSPPIAGGGSRICETTITVSAATINGSWWRSITAASGRTVPTAATIAATESAAISRSRTSKASQAITFGSYQSRNKLTSTTTAPSPTSTGPASIRRVIGLPDR